MLPHVFLMLPGESHIVLRVCDIFPSVYCMLPHVAPCFCHVAGVYDMLQYVSVMSRLSAITHVHVAMCI